MNKEYEEDFIVSEEDAEIIATLFRKGIRDFDSIVSALNWGKEKNLQLLDFITTMGYVDPGDLFDPDFDEDDLSIKIPEDKFSEFFQNLPIKFSDDWFDEEWHENAYRELRDFMIEIGKKQQKKKYSLDDVRTLIGMIFCPLTQKPETLCSEIQSLVCVSLRKTSKKEFSFKEILLAFDDAFDNYF